MIGEGVKRSGATQYLGRGKIEVPRISEDDLGKA